MSDPDREYLLRLSWPTRPLWQNHRQHWRHRHKAVKAYRKEAADMAMVHGVPCLPNAELHFTFAPPDRRNRDLHNMPGTMKAAIDGIADRMGCDDKGFKCHWPTEWAEPTKGGAVLIHVKPGKQP